MRKEDSPLLKILIIYYGLIQFIHLIALVYSAWQYHAHGTMSVLAAPPPGGWSQQAKFFLIGLGAADALVALLSVAFIVGYIFNINWAVLLGRICLTASLFSALIFAMGTLPTGAWRENPLPYFSMVILITPVIVLYFLLPDWIQSK